VGLKTSASHDHLPHLHEERIPSYLGSSFAFIVLIAVVGTRAQRGRAGEPTRCTCGLVPPANIVYMIVAAIIKVFGRVEQQAAAAAPWVPWSSSSVSVFRRRRQDVPVSGANRPSGIKMTYLAVADITLVAAIVFSSFAKALLKTIPFSSVAVGTLCRYRWTGGLQADIEAGWLVNLP
jgi:xanthine/uracil permease